MSSLELPIETETRDDLLELPIEVETRNDESTPELPIEIETRNDDEIKEWLTDINMSQYITNFNDNGCCSLDDLYLLDNDTKINAFINSIGIKKYMDKLKLKNHIKLLQKGIHNHTQYKVISKKTQNVLNNLNQLKYTVIKTHDSIHKKRENLKKIQETLLNEVNSFFDEYINIIKKRKFVVESEINAKIKQYNDVLNEKEKDIIALKDIVSNTDNVIKDIITVNNNDHDNIDTAIESKYHKILKTDEYKTRKKMKHLLYSMYITFDKNIDTNMDVYIKNTLSEIGGIQTENERLQKITSINDLILKNDQILVLKSGEYSYDNLILNPKSILTTNGYDEKTQEGGILRLNIKFKIELHPKSCIILNGLGYKGGKLEHQGNSFKGQSCKNSQNNYGGGGGVFHYHAYGYGGGYGSSGQGLGGGSCYGNYKLNELLLGSGGGGSYNANGGNGGGSIHITCNELIIHSKSGIYCNGNNGEYNASGGGSGAGSGGSIHIISNKITNKGSIHAFGGNSHYSGGFGRIRIDCNKIINNGDIIPKIGYNSTQIINIFPFNF